MLQGQTSNPMPGLDDSSDPEIVLSAVNHYDAIGDSITIGDELGFIVDPFGRPKKSSRTFQGWPGLLGHMLTETTGVETVVLIHGHQGDSVAKSQIEHLSEVMTSRSRSDHALLLLGTNDSNAFNPTPSGLGCAGTECDGTYKGYMERVIRNLQSAGRDPVYVGLLPPAWGAERGSVYPDPLDPVAAARNMKIQEYNQVIRNELSKLTGVKLGPDFFSCFLTPTVNRFSLFKDALHPNALGYAFMAALWRDAITGGPVAPPADPCPSPIYILESLDPYAHGHKQNLLATGDEYYTDEPFTLANIPSELAEGIWVSQADSDKVNTDVNFLSFDVGAVGVTVYIAYDPAGDAPTSLTHEFVPTILSESLAVSDPSVGTFNLVQASAVTGTVSIGGTQSAPGATRQQAYLVIVVL